LQGDVIISCYNHKIEIWDKKHYEEELKFDDQEFSRMAEELMGDGAPINIGFKNDKNDN
jgi:DNA-binding transcriptional regulator/RsmH inhibitor MraZ